MQRRANGTERPIWPRDANKGRIVRPGDAGRLSRTPTHQGFPRPQVAAFVNRFDSKETSRASNVRFRKNWYGPGPTAGRHVPIESRFPHSFAK
jgi:hypothetical protein